MAVEQKGILYQIVSLAVAREGRENSLLLPIYKISYMSFIIYAIN